ncbi:MAG TPA: MoaD/ThiS family protein [Anaerolineaceae bacterium]|nr:MoaD/ThiS family protein [Anaerolineaceae bacterium]
MKFTVKLYALLAAYVPGTRAAAPFEVELPEGSTIADLIQHLQIPPEEMKIAFVNGRMQPLEYLIQEGDEVGMFSPVGGGSEEEMHLDIWLYGDLARRGGREAPLGYAHLELAMPVGSRMQQLLDILDIPTEERGITFINGDLSAMPGLQPDLEHILADGDRVALFHLNSMWPFQYRHGAAMIPEMKNALDSREDGGLQHAYK